MNQNNLLFFSIRARYSVNAEYPSNTIPPRVCSLRRLGFGTLLWTPFGGDSPLENKRKNTLHASSSVQKNQSNAMTWIGQLVNQIGSNVYAIVLSVYPKQTRLSSSATGKQGHLFDHLSATSVHQRRSWGSNRCAVTRFGDHKVCLTNCKSTAQSIFLWKVFIENEWESSKVDLSLIFWIFNHQLALKSERVSWDCREFRSNSVSVQTSSNVVRIATETK